MQEVAAPTSEGFVAMALRVLVSGILELDSGKTWSVIALARSLLERGVRVALFKPVAGHNIWGSARTLRMSAELGMLVGNDISAYMRYLGGIDPGVSNPIALALAYPDPLAFHGVSQYLSATVDMASMLVLARVHDCRAQRTQHYVFPVNVSRLARAMQREVERLAERLGAAPADPGETLESLSGPGAESVLEGCRERLEEDAEVIIVESFNNVVAPYNRIVDVADFFVVVAPGRLMLYSGDRLRAAYEILGSVSRVDRILPVLSKPIATLELPIAESPIELAEHVGPIVDVIAP